MAWVGDFFYKESKSKKMYFFVFGVGGVASEMFTKNPNLRNFFFCFFFVFGDWGVPSEMFTKNPNLYIFFFWGGGGGG